jgi:hypothetical protein
LWFFQFLLLQNIYIFTSITEIVIALSEVLCLQTLLIDISFTIEQNVSIYHKFQTLRRWDIRCYDRTSIKIRQLWQLLAGLTKVAGDKGISEEKSKQQSPCSNCMHQLMMSWAMHAVHACISLWGVCISLWCHRLMHAITPWALLFWFCFGYTFTPATLGLTNFQPQIS